MYTLVFHQEQARSSVVYSEVSVLASTKIVHSGPSSLHRHVRHYDSGAPFLHRHVRSCTSETSLFRRHVHSCTRRRCFLRRHVRSCTQSRWYPQAYELFTRAVVSPQARSCGYLGGVVLRRHVHSCTSEPAPGTGTVDKCSQRGNGGNEAEAS